jgi:hypothetical protein
MKYIDLILVIKIVFILLTIIHLYLKLKQTHNALDNKIKYWKEKTEFIFITLTAILMLYVFNPRTNNTLLIDNEIKILLFLFAVVIIFTEDWDFFLKY